MKAESLIAVASLAVCFGVAVTTFADEPADAAFLEDVRAAWQARQDACRSYLVEWEEQCTTPRGRAGPGRSGSIPEQDATHTITYRMVGEGNRVRLTRRGMQYDINMLDFIEKDFIRVFDGRERRELFQSEKHGDHPGGFLNEGGFFDDGTYYRIQPVTLVFRPLATELGGIDLAEWSISNRPGSVDGTPCRILERPRGSFQELLWVADEPGYRVLRRQLLVPDAIAVEELTLGYESHPRWGPLCTEWTYVMRSGNANRVSKVSVVEDATVQVNLPVDPEEFRYTFPPGAVVRYEGTNRRAIALEDGTLRPVTAGEFSAGIPYEELMRTPPPPEAFPESRMGSWWWTLNRGSGRWWWTIAAVLAAILIVTGWLRHRRAAGR